MNEKFSIYTQLSWFEELEFLNLSYYGVTFEINKYFIPIADNCKNFKYLSIDVYTSPEGFDGLKKFNNLKTFELTVYYLRKEDIKFIEILNLTKLSIIDGNITNKTLKSLAKIQRLS